jgi:hypothetical protein
MKDAVDSVSKKVQRNLKEIFTVEDYQNFVRERVEKRRSNATYERQRRYNEFLRKNPLIFNQINIIGLTIEICENYNNLLKYVDGDLSTILSVTSSFCQDPLHKSPPTITASPMQENPPSVISVEEKVVETSASQQKEDVPPLVDKLEDLSIQTSSFPFTDESSSIIPTTGDSENVPIAQKGGLDANLVTWAKVETAILVTSDYQTYLSTEFGATDEAKELIQVFSTLTEKRSIQWDSDSFLRLLKKSVPRFKDISDVAIPTHMEAFITPQICFICRYVPKYLRCFQKSILSYLLHHVSQDYGTQVEVERSRVTVDAVDYLRFVEDGEFGVNFLKEKVTVLCDATGIITLKEESDFFVHKEGDDIFFMFSTKVDEDSDLFFCTHHPISIADFCETLSFFTSSNVFWPSVSSKKKSSLKRSDNKRTTKKKSVEDVVVNEESNIRSQTSVPFFTDKLLYKMIVELQNKASTYEEKKRELFEAIRDIIHVFLYNFFIIILIARLNIVYLLNSENHHEFVGEMFMNSENFLLGLEEKDFSDDKRDVVVRKLEYYSILLKYCFIAVEHIVFFLGLHVSVSRSRTAFPSDKSIKELVQTQKQSRLQFLHHLSELVKEKY